MAEDEESEGSVYEESREELVEGDEISPEEEGFMMGYEEADKDEKEEKDDEEDEDSEEKEGEEE
tara:strand:+ start:70 stop:261 length:192 start_codon:yes stop_codon:yes gene_type:complete